MKNANITLDLKTLLPLFRKAAAQFRRYSGLAFFIFLALLYGFILLRISALSNAQPKASDVADQAQSVRIPRVDDKVAEQLKNLKDNSVNVQALFDQNRSNPFQE